MWEDTFTVLTAQSLTGAFDNVASGARLRTAGGEGTFLIRYDAVSNMVVLSEFLAALLEADFNQDGRVDGTDFLIWQQNFGTPSGATMNDGDANGDGTVDGQDFLIWQTQFGSPAGSGASPSAVPEPAALILLAIAAATVTLLQRVAT